MHVSLALGAGPRKTINHDGVRYLQASKAISGLQTMPSANAYMAEA